VGLVVLRVVRVEAGMVVVLVVDTDRPNAKCSNWERAAFAATQEVPTPWLSRIHMVQRS
jgi:hypothetical protein